MSKNTSSNELIALQRHVKTVESRLATANVELEVTEARFRRLFENAPLGIISMDINGQVLDANPVILKILGSPSAEATRKINLLTFPPLIASGAAANLKRCIEENRTIVCEHPYTTAWGRDVHLRYHLTPILGADGEIQGLQAIVEDRAEARRAELAEQRFRETLEQASKIESVATLARGVGHDMSNILGAILGFASNLKLQAGPHDPSTMDIQGIIAATRKGRELMRALSNASRLDTVEPEPVEMHAVIKHCAEAVERTTSAKLQIQVVPGAGQSVVMGDPVGLQHALMHVCNNGVEAMDGVGHLTIETLNIAGEKPDEVWMRIRVTDTGPGISPEVVKRAFDPFFTTKARSTGKGLGLTLTYTTVRAHGGGVRLSGGGDGTTTTIDLPVAPGAVVPVSEGDSSGVFELPGQGEAVLLIEGDGLGQIAARRLLRSLGYKVLVADEGPLALEIFRNMAREIEVIILDADMSGVDGVELIEMLHEIDPDCPVILAAVDGDTRDLRGALDVLRKPFEANALVRALNAALGDQT